MNRTITFIGHRDAPESILNEVLLAIEKSICELDEIVFLIGGMGHFDNIATKAVREAKKTHPDKVIKLCLVLPSYKYVPKQDENLYISSLYDEIFVCSESDGSHYKSMIGKRNKWMVDQSHTIISYVHKHSGGAFKTLKYAEKHGIKIFNIK